MAVVNKTVRVAVNNLTPHPRNYREHPDEQIDELVASINQHGFYRNVVIAADNTILAGHGVVEACKRIGLDIIPAVRLDIDPDDPAALKVLAADNYLDHSAWDDDRALAELLREVRDNDTLEGTGFNDMSFAAFLMTTRSTAELRDIDHAAEWIGMPEWTAPNPPAKLIISCDSPDIRQQLVDQLGLITYGKNATMSARWPPEQRMDRTVVHIDAS